MKKKRIVMMLVTAVTAMSMLFTPQAAMADTTQAEANAQLDAARQQMETAYEACAETNEAEIATFRKVMDLINDYADVDIYRTPLFHYMGTEEVIGNGMPDQQRQELFNVANEATSGCTTDYEKIYTIYKLVADNIFYDQAQRRYGIYNAWVKKLGVCEEYSQLCTFFLCNVGIPCIRLQNRTHGFNAAYDSQAKRWIFFDATWGSRNKYTKDGVWQVTARNPETNRVETVEKDEWFLGRSYDTAFDYTAEDLAKGGAAHEMHYVKHLTDPQGQLEYRLAYKTDEWTNADEWHLVVKKIKDKSAESIYIPSELGGVPVTEIRVSAFVDSKAVKYIYVPESIRQMNHFGEIRATIEVHCDPSEGGWNLFDRLLEGSKVIYPCNNSKWTPELVKEYSRECNDPKKDVNETNYGAKFTAGHTWDNNNTCTLCGAARTYENPASIKTYTKKVRVNQLKKKVVKTSLLKVKGAKGAVTYQVLNGDKKVLKFDKKTGKVTVKKKTKKGTYKLLVRVNVSGTKTYDPAEQDVILSVTVK